jgi:hypothetical protein
LLPSSKAVICVDNALACSSYTTFSAVAGAQASSREVAGEGTVVEGEMGGVEGMAGVAGVREGVAGGSGEEEGVGVGEEVGVQGGDRVGAEPQTEAGSDAGMDTSADRTAEAVELRAGVVPGPVPNASAVTNNGAGAITARPSVGVSVLDGGDVADPGAADAVTRDNSRIPQSAPRGDGGVDTSIV